MNKIRVCVQGREEEQCPWKGMEKKKAQRSKCSVPAAGRGEA